MTDTISQNRTRLEWEIERIRANRDYSSEAKRRMMTEAYEKAVSEHRRLAEEERRQVARAIKQAERKVLGISYPEGARPHETAIIAMSYRDARDRAERAASDREDPDALATLLERAEDAGDDLLAEAAFHVATTRGVRSVADAYLQERPTARSRWESYVEMRQESAESSPTRGLLETAMAQVPPAMPPELRGGNAPAACACGMKYPGR